MNFLPFTHPVLSCKEAKVLESSVLADEAAEWIAMKTAGKGIAKHLVQDYAELRYPPDCLRILALIGKGNNGGDALIACGQLLADLPRARVDLILTLPSEEMRPLAARAFKQLEGRVEVHQVFEQNDVFEITQMLSAAADSEGFHICIDGLLGMAFSPPLSSSLTTLIEAVNKFEAIDLRASVDLPSGKGDDVESGAMSFRADFTYATGIAKKPIFEGMAECGRIRYIDLGFFEAHQVEATQTKESILTSAVLDPIRCLRPAAVDKRAFGHLFIIGGSAFMPGALLMAVQAAVSSGAGLVTAFAPASVASALAAQVPEAMWIPWPETGNGTLSPHAMPLLLDRVDAATALLVGPGMGKDRNTQTLTQEIVEHVEIPILLDADALRVRVMEVVQKRKPHFGRIVLTPHMGEFKRIAKLIETNYSIKLLLDFSDTHHVLTVLKGANTRICDGKSVIYNTQGGPVLSRGGSGDLLSGLIGGMIAQNSVCVPTAVAQGIMLHGMAAQFLAREKGQIAVKTTQLLEYLPKVLRT